ncbi:MAG: AAA family ATPase [Verrucomicrobiota bacterium]
MSDLPHPSDDADLNDALKDLAASTPGGQIDREPTGPRHLTKSQAAALAVLFELYQLQGQPERGGVVPRNKPLLVGPSGVGKTAVVRRLCDLEKADLLVVNAGSWIPFGASTHPHTLTVIRNFVAARERACLMIDEIDKACPHQGNAFAHSWSLGVFTEIVSLLDADLKLTTAGWNREQIDHFKRSIFMVGAGTWQKLTAKEGADVSGIAPEPETYEIPEEILFRFNPALIRLRPPERDDYVHAIRRVRESLELPVLDSTEMKRLVESAVGSRIGMRWIEHYLTQLLMQHPGRRTPVDSKPVKKSDRLQLSTRELEQKMAHLNAELEAAQEPVYRLAVELRCCLEQPPLLCEGIEPLPVADMKLMVSHLDLLRDGLQFGTRVNLSDMRAMEKILLESTARVIARVRKWIAVHPLALKHWNLLDRVVDVEVRAWRIRSLVISIPNLGIHDAP